MQDSMAGSEACELQPGHSKHSHQDGAAAKGLPAGAPHVPGRRRGIAADPDWAVLRGPLRKWRTDKVPKALQHRPGACFQSSF